MEKNLTKIFGSKEIIDEIDLLISQIETLNLSIREMVLYLETKEEAIIMGMHYTALLKGKNDLADKIASTQRLIKMKQIEIFKKAVQDDKVVDFMKDKTLLYIASLYFSMGFTNNEEDFNELTPENKEYAKILKMHMNNR